MRVAGYYFTKHALRRLMKRREIALEWIKEAIENPDVTEKVSEEELRFWKKIPDFGNRFLKVVINPQRKTIVTVHFDRRFKL
ncbi:DUF4258 domain-containing protein [Desulfurobacterium thermolithotrophum]|uniref:DUF4258 domain-containing protein n=1 Tax=Desulfurobacterium thermolithotrophum TaxID=64160 RepID=UPI0019536706|nr:DUF4258 domain-containing protein [Desulfurobacterium thermolithotrophum]